MKRTEKLSNLRKHKDNPRIIKGDSYKRLLESIKTFPEMLDARPLVVNKDMQVIGGNQRLSVLRELQVKETTVEIVDWSPDRQKEFMIKDNSSSGEWDFDMLANEWDLDKLENWNVSVPTIKNTELLSGLEYNPVYYEPEEKPDIKLIDCLDLEKYKAKLKALDQFDLTKKQKEVLKFFAYRFIKIDFESVANYYYFNADENEQKAIERLRLVLTDTNANGFIQDDLLKILGVTEDNIKDHD